MRFRAILCVFMVSLTMVSGWAESEEKVSEKQPKRVIYLLLDTLGAKHLHYMGYERETSPFLDALAAKSVNFEFCISHGDGTVYAMPAIFGSLYYSQLYLNPPNVAGLPPSVTTLPELFQEAGFRTLGWSTNPHVSSRTRYHQGFDVFHDMFPTGAVYSRIEHVIRKVRRSYKPSGGKEFIYVQLMDVHGPYNPPSPYYRMWADKYARNEFRDGRMTNRDGFESFSNLPYWSESHDVRQADIDYAIAQYDGEIRYLDDHLPELLAALRYNEEEDLVVVTSDHGEQFYENGYLGHNRSSSMAEIHVPLLIRHPGMAARTVETPVGVKDIYTTLCDIYGFEAPERTVGRSLLPAMRGEALSEEPIFTEGEPRRGPVAGVLHRGLYYHLSTEINRYHRPWEFLPVREKLYNIVNDPTLQHDILANRPDDRKAMNALLRQLTPRFEHATIEALDRSEDDVALGPKLMTGESSVALTPENAAWPIEVGEGVEAGIAHLLSFRYTLSEGVLRIDGVGPSPASGQPVYRFFRARQAPEYFQTVIYPEGNTLNIDFTLEGDTGKATLTDIHLRPVVVPGIPLVPWEGGAESFDIETENLTEEDIVRLEALGYIQ